MDRTTGKTPEKLSASEKETALLMLLDFSVSDVALNRCRSLHTVQGHCKAIRRKTCCANIYAALFRLFIHSVITFEDLQRVLNNLNR